MIKIEISTSFLIKLMLFIIIFLIIGHLIGQYSKFILHHEFLFGLVSMFDLNNEGNLPTIYSSSQLLLASINFGVIFCIKKIYDDLFKWHWLLLSIVFSFLALDEAAQIHELLNHIVKVFINASGIFYFAWLIPYSIITLALGVFYLKFILSLPRKTAFLFCLSAFIFLSGAIGFELLEGRVYEQFGSEGIEFAIYVSIEESLELIGIFLLIITQFDYIKKINELSIEIKLKS